jgi:hypothetical protein
VDVATEHLRGLARRTVETAGRLVPLRAALLVGSAGRGDADFYSDLDLILFVDALPADETLAQIREGVGGVNAIARGRIEDFCGEEFELQGVRTEVSFSTVTRLERRIEELRLGPEEAVETPMQTVAIGVLDGFPLLGAELVESWRGRLLPYPEPLRRAMIERHWRFFPLWYHAPALARRDAELWRIEVLLEAAFDLLGVLAGLNRLYFTRHELKRMRALIARMERAPADLADRLESLFELDPEDAGATLAGLVEETRALVAAEYPDLDLSLRFPPAARRAPWSVSVSGEHA